MEFKTGDWVVHCVHGLGQVQALEERVMDKRSVLYYAVQLADLTIWVPANENGKNRLRRPTDETGFQELLATLAKPAEPLPADRRQRSLQLLDLMKDGSSESLCRVVRDLRAYRRTRTWNEYDHELLRRAQKLLVGEWSFIRSLSLVEAEAELNGSLAPRMG